MLDNEDEEEYVFFEADGDGDWVDEIEWDEENETWQQVFRQIKPDKKMAPPPQFADSPETTAAVYAQKQKTPENWAKLKENHRLAKMAKRLAKWGRDYQLRLNGQQPGDAALLKAYQKVYGEKAEAAFDVVKKLPLKTAFASLKGRFGINAYVKVRLGANTDKHINWAALTFEEIQAQPEIQLANWRYFTRNWTVERRQKWADVQSVDEYKKKVSPEAKKEHGKLSFLLKHTDPASAQKILATYPGISFEELLKTEEVQIITFEKFRSGWSERMRDSLGDPRTYEEYLVAKKLRDYKNLRRWFEAVFKERASMIRE